MTRHNQAGLHPLKSLPQRKPISEDSVAPGWWELEQLWRIYPGQFTIVTGIPGHGKSTFLFNVICNLAKQYGTRSFLYVPENEGHLYAKLKLIWGPQSGWEGFAEDYCFVQSCMPESYDTPPQDLPWVLGQAVAAIEKDQCDILLIDPWNELEHCKPRDMLMTDYIRQSLMYLKQFSRAYGVSVILVAHPTKSVKDSTGDRIPTLSDIEGSMSWFNKCDNGLIVHREGSGTKVISAKVRELGAGRTGVCHFLVDPETGIFTPQRGAVTP